MEVADHYERRRLLGIVYEDGILGGDCVDHAIW